eukprot:5038064-Alexandrium_andersonii.AAC.1
MQVASDSGGCGPGGLRLATSGSDPQIRLVSLGGLSTATGMAEHTPTPPSNRIRLASVGQPIRDAIR